MRRGVLCVVGAITLWLATGASAGPRLPLGHAGRWITDAGGRVVVLHGFNMVYKLPPYSPGASGFGDDDATFLSAQGFNAVRVGIIYKAVEPRPGVYDDAYLNHVAGTVAALGRHGVVSLLDFHQDQFNETFQGEGFPDWAVQDDGLPHQPRQGFPGDYVSMAALQHAFDHFWSNDAAPGGVGLQDRFAAAWAHVAKRFRSDRNVLGYEILNEPWPGTNWQPCTQRAGCPQFDVRLGAMDRRVDRAIRTVDRHTLVFYEPAVLFNFGAMTNLPRLGDAQAGMAFHVYCTASAGAGQGNPCRAQDDTRFADAERHSAGERDALLMTEFGATDDTALLDAAMRDADSHRVGWLEWAYCGCGDPTGAPGVEGVVNDPAKPPTGANVKRAKLKLLAQPYPTLTAGTPRSWSFDPTSATFSLRYSVARADGHGAFAPGSESDVSVPAIEYPRGYSVTAAGGTVLSRPRAPELRIASCPGAKTVAVRVTKGRGVHQSCRPRSRPRA